MTWSRGWLLWLACCQETGTQSVKASPTAGPAARDANTVAGTPSAALPNSYEDETSTRPVELLKSQFASGIKDREPLDEIKVARPGTRTYLHLVLRNRSQRERKVQVSFSVNGDKRSEVTLNVADAWSFRTWGYNTLRKADTKGKLTAVVEDDEGHLLGELQLPIEP